MIRFEVPDNGLQRLSPLALLAVLVIHASDPTAIFDQHAGIVGFHNTVAQNNHCLFDGDTMVATQDFDLLDLLMQRVALIWISRERLGTQYETGLMRHGNARVDGELVGIKAFHF